MEKYRVFNTKNRILALILVVVMSFQLVSNYIPGSYAANEPVVLNMASVSQDVYIYTSLRVKHGQCFSGCVYIHISPV